MKSLRSTQVVTPTGLGPATVVWDRGEIVAVLPWHDAPPDTLDLGDLAVLPGLVDLHVHVNEPGRSDWEGYWSATRAALAGGVTTLVDMPLNSFPATTSAAALAAKRAATVGQLHTDVAFHGGVVPGNTNQLADLAADGVVAFKAFLSPSGIDDFGHVSAVDLERAMPVLTQLGLPLLVHAELVHPVEPAAGTTGYQRWLASRPPSFEVAAIEQLADLVARHGTRVHVVHVASAEALAAIDRARAAGLPISAETCPHYLCLCAQDIPNDDPRFKCAPPIRERVHRAALWAGIRDGRIATIGSDHSPAPASLKHVSDGDFDAAWGGIASLELSFSVCWTAAQTHGMDLGRLVEVMATTPATLVGLGRKGAIAPGYDADLVAIDLEASFVVDQMRLHQRHPICPYDGTRLSGQVEHTWLRGQLAFDRRTGFTTPAGRIVRRS